MIAKKYVFTCDQCRSKAGDLLDVDFYQPLNWYKVTPFEADQKINKKTGENSFITRSSKKINSDLHFCSQDCMKKYFSSFFNF